jgi:hypothetical protein
MKKKQNLTITEITALIGISTTSLIQLVPVIDSHPIGGAILAAVIVIAALSWIMKRQE